MYNLYKLSFISIEWDCKIFLARFRLELNLIIEHFKHFKYTFYICTYRAWFCNWIIFNSLINKLHRQKSRNNNDNHSNRALINILIQFTKLHNTKNQTSTQFHYWHLHSASPRHAHCHGCCSVRYGFCAVVYFCHLYSNTYIYSTYI